MKAINILAMILLIVGGINWGLVGLFDADLVAALFGDKTVMSRIIYSLVGLAGLWGLYMLVPLSRGSEEAHLVRH